jgi:hypothetical protein
MFGLQSRKKKGKLVGAKPRKILGTARPAYVLPKTNSCIHRSPSQGDDCAAASELVEILIAGNADNSLLAVNPPSSAARIK